MVEATVGNVHTIGLTMAAKKNECATLQPAGEEDCRHALRLLRLRDFAPSRLAACYTTGQTVDSLDLLRDGQSSQPESSSGASQTFDTTTDV